MIPKDCKRLIEVDFPIAEVSRHAAREKSTRHGHPSTLHLWWARRPLAACRAMLMALLLPDPCDPHCPKEFKAKAAKALLDVPGWGSQRRQEQVKSDEGLRRALLDFAGDAADWDVANNPRWIGAARELVKAAHPDETPLVVDPFAGGGSIPLEALRLGCESFASDPHLDPQLVWAGKAEHTSFEVPTVSLHVHERIEPRTIIEAVRKHPSPTGRGAGGEGYQLPLFEVERQEPLREAIELYQHKHGWTNRLIAGDSLLVMNSLLIHGEVTA